MTVREFASKVEEAIIAEINDPRIFKEERMGLRIARVILNRIRDEVDPGDQEAQCP